MKKIVYIGVNGRIGRNFLPMFVNISPSDEDIEFVLITSKSKNSFNKINGLIKEIKGLLIAKHKDIKFIITDDYSNIKNADIVICSANVTPTQEQKDYFKQIDNTGRMVQSLVNNKIILEIVNYINLYSPEPILLLVTNQVDILCHLIRERFNNLNVVGVGGYIDSMRLRQIFFDKYKLKTNSLMLGYHNNSMFPLMDSIPVDLQNTELFNIIQLVKDYGMIISIEQGYGSSILPANALIDFVNAYLFNHELINSFNVKITDKNVVNYYGVELNTSLSIPIKISYKKINYLTNYKVTNNEKLNIQKSINDLKRDIKIINDYND